MCDQMATHPWHKTRKMGTRVSASGPNLAYQRTSTCKRQGELSELAFVYKAASLGLFVQSSSVFWTNCIP
jgi:hypothetical protein